MNGCVWRHRVSRVYDSHRPSGDRRRAFGSVCLNQASYLCASTMMPRRLNGVSEFWHILQFTCEERAGASCVT
jgi:hypothetical protein